jgi:MOSC domain-containing protein YiiM
MDKGTIISVNISEEKGKRKHSVESVLITSTGLQGDAHAGNWHRQVSLLSMESIEKMRQAYAELSPGDFAENLTTQGFALSEVSVGNRLRAGESILEITQIGKECHVDCEIRQKVGDCIMPIEGVFAKVIEPGRVTVGDTIEIIDIK